jgi:hypothetical protein
MEPANRYTITVGATLGSPFHGPPARMDITNSVVSRTTFAVSQTDVNRRPVQTMSGIACHTFGSGSGWHRPFLRGRRRDGSRADIAMGIRAAAARTVVGPHYRFGASRWLIARDSYAFKKDHIN